jgi:hypothetical protein
MTDTHDVSAEIVAELKLRFPTPWFTNWRVRTYYGTDGDGRETNEEVAHQAFVRFVAADFDYLVTLVLLTKKQVLAAVRALPLPAAEQPAQSEPQPSGQLLPDYLEADGTDAAHPAWWRGQDHGVHSLCQHINEILDGKEPTGVSREPWESTRKNLAALREQLAELGEIAEEGKARFVQHSLGCSTSQVTFQDQDYHCTCGLEEWYHKYAAHQLKYASKQEEVQP